MYLQYSNSKTSFRNVQTKATSRYNEVYNVQQSINETNYSVSAAQSCSDINYKFPALPRIVFLIFKL